MVRFCSGKTTVQLSVTDLEKTAGTNAETSQNAKQTSNIHQCNLEFVNGSENRILPEVYINDPEDGMSTHFLGKNIPFLMAQAGYNIVSPTASEIRNTRPARIQLEDSDEERRTRTVTYTSLDRGRVYTPPSKPQALCLTVSLEPKAFISLESKDRMAIRDIKIDAVRSLLYIPNSMLRLTPSSSNATDIADFGIEPVYLNGHFFDSELVRYGYATRNSATTKQFVRFTGYRIGRLIEKPWIIVPSGQDPDGTAAQYHDRGSDAPGKRWHDISTALLFAADRAGRNRDGERSALGEYLESLASLPMQPEVACVQKPGSANFGVIDVVISWAKGTKANLVETGLGRPMLAIVEGYEYIKPVDVLVDTTAKDTASRISSPDTAPRTPTSIPAGTDLFDDSAKDTTTSDGNAAAYPSPTSCAPTPPASMAPTANIGRSTTGGSRLVASSSRKRTRSASIPGPESQFKRPKQTLEQEIASIQKRAEEDNRQRKASKAGPRSTPSGIRRKNWPVHTKESSTDEDLSPKSISLVGMNNKNHNPGEAKLPKDSTLSTEMEDETYNLRISPKSKLKLPSSTMKLRAPGKINSHKERSRTKAVFPGQPHDAGFEVPELSRDCVITYAPPGLVRNVGASRKSFLVEEGAVIVGVRFLVG